MVDAMLCVCEKPEWPNSLYAASSPDSRSHCSLCKKLIQVTNFTKNRCIVWRRSVIQSGKRLYIFVRVNLTKRIRNPIRKTVIYVSYTDTRPTMRSSKGMRTNTRSFLSACVLTSGGSRISPRWGRQHTI